jgi:hypothetical protein
MQEFFSTISIGARRGAQIDYHFAYKHFLAQGV